jgi:hypothetical protein
MKCAGVLKMTWQPSATTHTGEEAVVLARGLRERSARQQLDGTIALETELVHARRAFMSR